MAVQDNPNEGDRLPPTRIRATLLWHGVGSGWSTVRKLSRDYDSCTAMVPLLAALEILIRLDHGQVKSCDEVIGYQCCVQDAMAMNPSQGLHFQHITAPSGHGGTQFVADVLPGLCAGPLPRKTESVQRQTREVHRCSRPLVATSSSAVQSHKAVGAA